MAVASIQAYLKELPPDRKRAISALRKLVLSRLPDGYQESFSFGMLSYEVPLAVYPDTYNKKPLMYAALGSQKGHFAVYLCNVNGMPSLRKKLEVGFKAAGKKLDMGKSCVRFKELEDVPLEVIGDAIAATPLADYVAFAKAQRAK